MKRFKVFAAMTLVTLMIISVYPATQAAAGDSRISLGIKAGGVMAGCSGLERLWDQQDFGLLVPTVDKGFKPGLAAGIYLDYRINGHISLQPEILYSQQGCKRNNKLEINQVVGTIEAEYEVKMDATPEFEYVNIPILAKYVFRKGGSFSPYLLAGPSVGIKLSAEMPYEVEYTYREYQRNGPMLFSADTSYTETYDIDDLVKSTNIGMVLGAGCVLETGGGVFTFEVRYAHGFTDVMDKTGRIELKPDDFIQFDEAKLHDVSFMVGYRIPLWR